MRVLSLFDGMSCAQLALKKNGIKPLVYWASEIDKYAIKITQKNFPETVQLGDVKEIDLSQIGNVDLLIGGSPCQGFSYAGKMLNFKDKRSKLFFEYVRVMKDVKPKWFILENVKMKKESMDIISEYLGVEPIEINSSLVSAQNRKRLYWTNIPNVELPDDRGILLKDIIEDGIVDRDKPYCIDANYHKGGNPTQYFEKHRRQLVFVKDGTKRGYSEARVGDVFDLKFPNSKTRRGRKMVEKSNCLETRPEFFQLMPDLRWRKLTPLECERLQTVPDNYTEGVSNTQRFKMLGNGFTVDVIAHILSFINKLKQ